MLLDQGVHKIEKKKHVQCVFQFLKLNISSVKELLHTFRNPVKYNWSSTRKTEKKHLLGFILQDITP